MSELNPKSRGSYKFWLPENVRYADLEPQKHVNNMTVGVYFQSARIALLSQLGIMWGTPDQAIVIARTINDFYREITYPNQLDVGLCITHLGNSSFTLLSGVFIGDDCAATQESIAVYWNPAQKQKRLLDDAIRAKLQAYFSGPERS